MGTIKTKAALYLRKSTKDTRDSEHRSLADQKRDCLEQAKRMNLEVVHVYEEEEGVSRSHIKNHEAPVWEQFLQDIGKDFHTGIVWSFDRSTRKGMGDMGQILDHLSSVGGRIVDTQRNLDTSIEHNRMLLGIESEISRGEITRMQERVVRGKEGQRLRGEMLGGKPSFGLARDKEAPYGVRVIPEEAKAIQVMVGQILDGKKISETIRWMHEEGYRSSGDRMFTRQSANKFLRSPHLIGHRYYIKQNETFCDAEGNPVQVHEPIISEADYYRLQKIVTPKKGTNKKWQQGTEPSPLFGFAKCACCGKRLYYPARYKTEKTGQRTYQRPTTDRYAKCHNTACTDKASAYYDVLHDYVVTAALSFAATLDTDSPVLEEVSRRWIGTTTPEVQGQRDALKDRIDVLHGKVKQLAGDYYDKEIIDRETFNHQSAQLDNKINDLKIDLAQLPEKDLDISPILDLTQYADGEESLVGEGSAWAALDVHTQHSVLMCLIDEVVLTKGDTKSPIRAPLEERLTISFVTENNVYELKDRKFDIKKVAVAAS